LTGRLRLFDLSLAQIALVAAFVSKKLTFTQRPHFIGQGIHQEAIVRHQQHGACKTVEHVLQNLLRSHIEMICRLVQQQEIGALQREPGQRHAAALTAAEHADRLEDIVARKEEASQEVARLRQRQVLHLQNGIEHRLVGIQPGAGLRQVAGDDAGAQTRRAAQRLDLLQDCLDERGLAGAVGADQGHALSAADFQVGHGDQGVLAAPGCAERRPAAMAVIAAPWRVLSRQPVHPITG